jgi:hypothetical protein
MTPYHLELLLFHRMNKDNMWDVTDVQNILDELAEKVAAPVAGSR